MIRVFNVIVKTSVDNVLGYLHGKREFLFFCLNKTFTMYKLFLFTLFLSISSYGQERINRELDSILNIDQAEMYLANNPSKGSKLISFNEEKHKTTLAKELFERGRSTVESDFKITHYKVVESNNNLHYRFSYIFINGENLSKSEIFTLRSQIMAKFEKGIPFNKLAMQYSMDSNARRGGDSGWLKQGSLEPEIEDAVINSSSSIGDLMTFDIPEKQKHYLILKTHDIKYIKEVKALKIVEQKN